jgi:hypothetical protein
MKYSLPKEAELDKIVSRQAKFESIEEQYGYFTETDRRITGEKMAG